MALRKKFVTVVSIIRGRCCWPVLLPVDRARLDGPYVFSVFARILLKRSQISTNNSFFHLVLATKLYIKQHLKIKLIISLRIETACGFLSLTTPIQTEGGPTTSVRFQRRVMAT